MANETLLVINGPGISPFSARGLKQTLDPIDAAGVFGRTVNGQLINLSPPAASGFQKYKSTISCTDQDPPAFDGVWPGTVLQVECAAELGYHTATGAPTRDVVAGSERTASSWTYYRPSLTMVVIKYTVEQDEWGKASGWQLDLEEQ